MPRCPSGSLIVRRNFIPRRDRLGRTGGIQCLAERAQLLLQPIDLLLLAAMGVMGTVTQGCYIKGMQIGDAGAMAPIDYSRLVFTAVVGFVLFQEVPTWATIAGAVIVVASTLFITLREQQLAKAHAAKT